MENKLVSLIQLTNLKDDSKLSEDFVCYYAGLASTREYKHQEILDLDELLKNLNLSPNDSSGFIFGYLIPQLNKEFDLIKITKDYVLNIELKSQQKDEIQLAKQLIQNIHYLKLLKKQIYCFTFVSSTKKLYKLVNDDELQTAEFEELKELCSAECVAEVDLDEIFAPKHILVSPLNNTQRFLNGDYLLTENQESIKKKILTKLDCLETAYFFGLTGGPGTGKTLLLYDVAKQLSLNKKVLIIHSGLLCDGHFNLQNRIKNLRISDAKALRWREINNVDYVLVDEAQRLYESALDKIEKWVIKAKTICVFSYDPNQRVSYSENSRKTVDRINSLCGENKEKLTTKIRTNKEMAQFINCLTNLKNYKSNYRFSHVKIFYEPDKTKAMELANHLGDEDYKYISFTPSFYDHSLDYQKGKENTHTVIGQEFDKVCMIMDSNFYYKDGKLEARQHPNPDYIFTKLLNQGITRARSDLALIITDKELLQNILILFNNR